MCKIHYLTFSLVQARWFGRTLLDVCADEFKNWSREYFQCAIADGRIRIHEQRVSSDYVLKSLDILRHDIHRHEPSVCSANIDIVHETDELVVVNKPPSMTIHPSGLYRLNSMVFILEKDLGMQLFPIHRLDKLTSGLVILARTAEIATRFQQHFVDLSIHKEYVARVNGEFPETEVLVDQPIACIDRSRGVHAVRADGKSAQTVFRRLSYNGHTSVVLCQPRTGRTHQIRVHLQWLGFPISNDKAYGGQNFVSNTFTNMMGFEYAQSGLQADRALLSPLQALSQAAFEKHIDSSDRIHLAPSSLDSAGLGDSKSKVPALEALQQAVDPTCPKCQDGAYWDDFKRYPGLIWLHALRYSCPQLDLHFEVPSPHWAQSDYDSRMALSMPLNDSVTDATAAFDTEE
jgi:tRNA pseudouridine synthase 9